MSEKIGRPLRDESNRRVGEFVGLIAAGSSYERAAKQAGIDPFRALRIVEHKDFPALVDAVREAVAVL